MRRLYRSKLFLALVAALPLGGFAFGQIDIGDVIKVLGVGAAVKQFGPEINRSLNKLSGHKDTASVTTKVVPILSIKILRGDNAIGAAQVSGPKAQVDKVQAVAQPETNIFGAVRARVFIPVSSKDVVKDIKKVDGVAVTGIVDLKL